MSDKLGNEIVKDILERKSKRLTNYVKENKDISCVIIIETLEKTILKVHQSGTCSEELKKIIASLENYMENSNDKTNNNIKGTEST